MVILLKEGLFVSLNLNNILEKMIEEEVEKRVYEKVKELENESEEYGEELSDLEIMESAIEIFQSMPEDGQIDFLKELIGLSDEWLYDSFAEGKHGINKFDKLRVAFLMMLEQYED